MKTLSKFGLCAAITALLFACNTSTPTTPNNESIQTVAGRFQGDASLAKSASSVQGAVVIAYAISSDGSYGQEVARDTTDAQGNFKITTDRLGLQNWVLITTQGGMQWMTRYADTLAEKDQDTARPMNFESTLQTQVYLNLQKTDAGRKVSPAEMTTAIDVNAAASSKSLYENGDSSSRSSIISHFSAVITAQCQARSAYMEHASVQYLSDTTYASLQMHHAEAGLTAALYAANGDSAQTRLAESAYLQALISANSRSDSGSMSYARSNEAAYHATVMVSAQFTDSTKNTMRRRSLHIMAAASDTAMHREFLRANASQIQLQAVATASANFEKWADTSRSDASRDSAASRFRAEIRSVFQSQGTSSDSSFIALLNLSVAGSLSTSLSSTSALLQTALAADVTASNSAAIGQHLQTYNAQAVTQIAAQWQGNSHNTGNTDRNSAMAQIMAFLSVRNNHG